MPLRIHQESDPALTVIHATGTLEKADYKQFVSDFEALAGKHGKLCVLFDMTGFHGWTTDALWSEIKFDARHFEEIERLAAIGVKEWEKGLLLFAKPFTKATIRYFDESEAAEARQWLTQG